MVSDVCRDKFDLNKKSIQHATAWREWLVGAMIGMCWSAPALLLIVSQMQIVTVQRWEFCMNVQKLTSLVLTCHRSVWLPQVRGGEGGRVLASVRLLCLVPGILMQQVPQRVSPVLTHVSKACATHSTAVLYTIWALDRMTILRSETTGKILACHVYTCTSVVLTVSLLAVNGLTALKRNICNLF